MIDKQNNDLPEDTEESASGNESLEAADEKPDDIEELKKTAEEANNKYIRLYADFENYKKITARNREELLKYANEDLLSDILTVIDHLELALQHATGDESSSPLSEGVELTLKELKNVLEKHGLQTIDALGKPFDPVVHHAMSKIESEEEENTVIREFRKGYMLKDRVLRAAMVGVATKQSQPEKSEPGEHQDNTVKSEE